MAMKSCPYSSSTLCSYNGCDVFDCSSGNVGLCRLFRGGDRFSRRKLKADFVSIFDIWAGRVDWRGSLLIRKRVGV